MLGTNSSCRLTHDSCGFRDAAAHLRHFRQPEIQNLCMPALGDEDVGGFDVAVDDTFGVSGIERIGNLDSKRQQHLGFQRTPCDAVLQCHAVQELHHDERLISVPADLVNRADIWVVEGRCGSCFPPKAFERLRVSGYIFREKLEGDKATKVGVLGFVDHTHPAAAQLLDDAVVGDGLADEL